MTETREYDFDDVEDVFDFLDEHAFRLDVGDDSDKLISALQLPGFVGIPPRALTGLLLLTYVVIRLWLTRNRRLTRRERWDGGVRRLLPEMTYTATGFSNPVRVMFDAIFRPTTVEDTSETVAEHFRMAIRREKEHVHLVDKLVFQPVRSAALWFARGLALMHHGRINAYVTYAFLVLLIVCALLPGS